MFELTPMKFLRKMMDLNFVICMGCIVSGINWVHCLRREIVSGNLNLYKDANVQYSQFQ